MTDGDNKHPQFSVMDFINHPIIVDADSLGIPAFEFFHVRRRRICFEPN